MLSEDKMRFRLYISFEYILSGLKNSLLYLRWKLSCKKNSMKASRWPLVGSLHVLAPSLPPGIDMTRSMTWKTFRQNKTYALKRYTNRLRYLRSYPFAPGGGFDSKIGATRKAIFQILWYYSVWSTMENDYEDLSKQLMIYALVKLNILPSSLNDEPPTFHRFYHWRRRDIWINIHSKKIINLEVDDGPRTIYETRFWYTQTWLFVTDVAGYIQIWKSGYRVFLQRMIQCFLLATRTWFKYVRNDVLYYRMVGES